MWNEIRTDRIKVLANKFAPLSSSQTLDWQCARTWKFKSTRHIFHPSSSEIRQRRVSSRNSRKTKQQPRMKFLNSPAIGRINPATWARLGGPLREELLSPPSWHDPRNDPSSKSVLYPVPARNSCPQVDWNSRHVVETIDDQHRLVGVRTEMFVFWIETNKPEKVKTKQKHRLFNGGRLWFN